jgi:ribose 5-phosphate isomerase A
MAAFDSSDKVSQRMESSEQNEWKRAAAEAAARLVEDGMVLGLGTGSTAKYFLNALGRRVAEEGLRRITGIPTSDETASQARSLGIPLTSFAEHVRIDLDVDGADEVETGTLFLIKGHGGALLREKIVATASKRVVIVVDETKLVERLGSLMAVPVEAVQFGWQTTAKYLSELGGNPSLRLGVDRKPFVTNGGNYILDCAFGPMANPKEVAHHLDHVVGAIEHGLFLGLTKEVIVGEHDGVRTVKKGS